MTTNPFAPKIWFDGDRIIKAERQIRIVHVIHARVRFQSDYLSHLQDCYLCGMTLILVERSDRGMCEEGWIFSDVRPWPKNCKACRD